MLKNLAIGLPLMLLCLVVQIAFAFWAVRHYVRRTRQSAHPPLQPLLLAMLVLTLGNFVQIVAWGLLFLLLGEFTGLYDAVYHSGVNFTSLGYGDVVMSAGWKLLGPLEALNGILMLGITSAALMAILQHMIKINLMPSHLRNLLSVSRAACRSSSCRVSKWS
jgi:hypothetical protein